MNSLNQFLDVIKVADKPLSDECKAYYMDGGRGVREMPDLRADVGLGSCHCCDYFLPHDESVLLIEETRLFETEKSLKEQYHYLNDEHKKEFSKEKFFSKYHLKVYGSLLVLYRLANKYPCTKKLIHGRKYCFWLVVSQMNSRQMKVFDNLVNKLQTKLQSTLTPELLIDVKILPADMLESKLKNTTHP